MVVVVVGLFVGGSTWRVLRGASRALSPSRRGSGARWLACGFVAVPVLLILLAKLFDSAVLGWAFGLTLALEAALVPCGFVFAVGYCVAARWMPPRDPLAQTTPPTRTANAGPAAPRLPVRIDRDSVCAGDDTEPHDRVVAADPNQRLSTFIESLRRDGVLASIRGGEATWLIESSAHPSTAIGVCAQQWSQARLCVTDEALATHFAGRPASIVFRYRCQASPEDAWAALRSGARTGRTSP